MSRTSKKFSPDSGTTLSGNTPAIGSSGRGIPRTGDIRHIGDVVGPGTGAGQVGTLTPGSIANLAGTSVGAGDSVQAAENSGLTPTPKDAESAAAAFGSAGTYGGLDASDEGKDNFGSKAGRP